MQLLYNGLCFYFLILNHVYYGYRPAHSKKFIKENVFTGNIRRRCVPLCRGNLHLIRHALLLGYRERHRSERTCYIKQQSTRAEFCSCRQFNPQLVFSHFDQVKIYNYPLLTFLSLFCQKKNLTF